MNVLVIIVIAFFLLTTFNGARKGLVRGIFSCGTALLAIVLTVNCYHYVGKMLEEHTQLKQSIQKQVVKSLELKVDDGEKKVDRTDQTKFIDQLPLPEGLKTGLMENNNDDIYSALRATGFYDYISGYLASTAINGIAFMVTFIAAAILIRLLLRILDFITELPVLNGLNRIGGVALGMIEGMVGIWLFLLVVTILGNTAFGKSMYQMINESVLLTVLYNNNYLLIFLTGMSKLLF